MLLRRTIFIDNILAHKNLFMIRSICKFMIIEKFFMHFFAFF